MRLFYPHPVTTQAWTAHASVAAMRAIVFNRYGPADVLEVRDLDMPVVQDDQVLVRVRATSLNPQDWHAMTGTPWLVRMSSGLRRPKDNRLGNDFAGVVEAVGSSVT